ncbi:MAG: hypothetical protein HY289_00670 [Planctomycetes bacterium]|nr:hypothetical protein [Planctomycetota bacterium]
MGLPEFEARGTYPFLVLPDGVHVTDEANVRQRLVADFPQSQTRARICEGLFLLRSDALELRLVATQWIDGSFVESKIDPGDVDLVSFMDADYLNGLDTKAQVFVEACLNGEERTKSKYQSHTFLVPSCLPHHRFHPAFEAARRYWRKWFGHTRRQPIRPGPIHPQHPKGIVELALGDPNVTPKISNERVEP